MKKNSKTVMKILGLISIAPIMFIIFWRFGSFIEGEWISFNIFERYQENILSYLTLISFLLSIAILLISIKKYITTRDKSED